jgi:hypothetical protein
LNPEQYSVEVDINCLKEDLKCHFIIAVKMLGCRVKNSLITFNVNSKYSRVYCESHYCWVDLVPVGCLEIGKTKGTGAML